MSRGSFKKIAFGAAIIGVLGYLAGILTAPKSGRETREDIKGAANAGLLEAEKQLKGLHTELGELLSELKAKGAMLQGRAATEAQELMANAQAAKEKAREVLSAIHEGDAEDEDLKKAVKQANLAIDHLRAYLKK